jgi:hypothetical protein
MDVYGDNCHLSTIEAGVYAEMHTLLWNAHFYVAFVFFALILLHVAAALFHALVRRDGVFDAMAPVPAHDEVAPAQSDWPFRGFDCRVRQFRERSVRDGVAINLEFYSLNDQFNAEINFSRLGSSIDKMV